MRIFEFDNQLAAAVKSNLLFLKSLSDDHNIIKVDALINLLKKQHILFSYDGLKELIDNDHSLKHIIKDFNKEEITLGDEDEDKDDQNSITDPNNPDNGLPTDENNPESDEEQSDDSDAEHEEDNIEDRVSDMAKKSNGKDRVAKMAANATKRRS